MEATTPRELVFKFILWGLFSLVTCKAIHQLAQIGRVTVDGSLLDRFTSQFVIIGGPFLHAFTLAYIFDHDGWLKMQDAGLFYTKMFQPTALFLLPLQVTMFALFTRIGCELSDFKQTKTIVAFGLIFWAFQGTAYLHCIDWPAMFWALAFGPDETVPAHVS